MKTSIIVAICLGMVALTAAPVQAKDPEGVNPTHFLCYRVVQTSALKPTSVKLQDQFGASGSKLGKAVMLCTPVSKNGEPVKDKRTHLTCYTITPKKVGKKVLVVHQFGKQTLSVASSYMLCLPSLKEVMK
jgi:hypothetical protein